MSISVTDFNFVTDLVRRESAIVLQPGKEYLVEARLAPLAKAAGMAKVGDFVRQVSLERDRKQCWAIVEALTTNETSWFRDASVYEGFRTELLPKLKAARRMHQPLRIWSAAASTGQEAYSLAMMLIDELEPGRRYEIVGTDISGDVLEQARAGRYSQLEMNRGLPARHLVRFFQRRGVHWEVTPELRRDVTFRELNLAAPFIGLPRFDVIFMRNVLIYFDQETKRSILRRVRQVMASDGWLILGTAETTRGIDDEYELVRMAGLSAYRLHSGASLPTRRG